MKNFWLILILAIVVKILVSAITFHPDTQAFNLAGKLISSGNILNLYDYLPSLPDSDPTKNLAVLNYPPAIYLFNGVFNFIFGIFGLPINQFLLDIPSNYGNLLFNIHLLLLKLPYLIFDLLIGFILFKLFRDKKQANLALIIWLFNPISLLSTYMMGQFDIIPTLFTVLSIYFAVKNKLNWAAISLGIGIAFKLYPIFLLTPLLILGKGTSEKIKIFILSLAPYFLIILPYLPSHNFRSTALFANQSSKSLYAAIPVSGGESILLFPASLIFFYLLLGSNKIERISFWKIYLIILLLFFIFTHFHPQWLIWITPFLILDLVYLNFKNLLAILIILFTWLVSLFFFDQSLTVGIFSPLLPVLQNTSSVWSMLHLNPDYTLLRSILQTFFTAASAYLIYTHFPKKSNNEI